MRCKGSVTVFSALCLMLIASFLFALLEAGRVHMLEAYADMTSELALESVCAEYQPGLWENYDLLCLDGAYGGSEFSVEYIDGILKQRIDRNLSRENLQGNLLTMKLNALEMEDYQLLTDGEGSVFLKRIAAYMKENFSLEAAELLYKRYTQGEEIEKEASVEGSIEDAQKAIDDAKKNQAKANQTKENPEEKMAAPNEEEIPDRTEPVEVKENPLEIALELKQNAILGMVLEDVDAVSARQIDTSQSLQRRNCRIGNMDVKAEVEWYEKVLALEYLGQYYGNYRNAKENHALAYEMEYVLCGKETDKANLEGAVNRLMLLREAVNAVRILADREKRNEAMLLANALAGFTGNPAIIKVVEIGIIGAWAYMDSLDDVRALLRGDRIPLVTNREQNSEKGLSYQEYVKLLLFGQREKILAYRMMDMMEQNVRLSPLQRHCRMDHMICKVTYRIEYQARTIFSRDYKMNYLKVKQFSYY